MLSEGVGFEEGGGGAANSEQAGCVLIGKEGLEE